MQSISRSIIVFLYFVKSCVFVKGRVFVDHIDSNYVIPSDKAIIENHVSTLLNKSYNILERLPIFIQNNELLNVSVYSYITDKVFSIHSKQIDGDKNVVILRYPSSPLPLVRAYFVLIKLKQYSKSKRAKALFYGSIAYIRDFYSPVTLEWGMINYQGVPYYGKESFISALIYQSGFSSSRRRNKRAAAAKLTDDAEEKLSDNERVIYNFPTTTEAPIVVDVTTTAPPPLPMICFGLEENCRIRERYGGRFRKEQLKRPTKICFGLVKNCKIVTVPVDKNGKMMQDMEEATGVNFDNTEADVVISSGAAVSEVDDAAPKIKKKKKKKKKKIIKKIKRKKKGKKIKKIKKIKKKKHKKAQDGGTAETKKEEPGEHENAPKNEKETSEPTPASGNGEPDPNDPESDWVKKRKRRSIRYSNYNFADLNLPKDKLLLLNDNELFSYGGSCKNTLKRNDHVLIENDLDAVIDFTLNLLKMDCLPGFHDQMRSLFDHKLILLDSPRGAVTTNWTHHIFQTEILDHTDWLKMLSSIYFPLFVNTFGEMDTNLDYNVSLWAEFITQLTLRALNTISFMVPQHTVKLILSMKDILTAQMMALINKVENAEQLLDFTRFAILREFVESKDFITLISEEKINIVKTWEEYRKNYQAFEFPEIESILGSKFK